MVQAIISGIEQACRLAKVNNIVEGYGQEVISHTSPPMMLIEPARFNKVQGKGGQTITMNVTCYLLRGMVTGQPANRSKSGNQEVKNEMRQEVLDWLDIIEQELVNLPLVSFRPQGNEYVENVGNSTLLGYKISWQFIYFEGNGCA